VVVQPALLAVVVVAFVLNVCVGHRADSRVVEQARRATKKGHPLQGLQGNGHEQSKTRRKLAKQLVHWHEGYSAEGTTMHRP